MKYRTAKVIRRIAGVVWGGGLILAMLQPAHATVITNAGTFSVGSAGGDNNNVVTVTNNVAPIIQMTAGAVLVGSPSGGGTAGGNDNTVILSNATLTTSAAGILGAGSSNNSLTLLAGTAWNNANFNLIVGALAATGNVLTANGGVISNIGALFIGSGTGATSNQLVIVNGGIVSNAGGLNIGSAPRADFNSLIVTNGGRLFVTGDILIGAAFNNGGGGGNNTVILSNSVLTEGGSSFGTTIGSGSSNNTLTLLANTVLNTVNQPLNIGMNASTGNVVTISGGLGTIASDLTIGSGAGSIGNSLIVTNGGWLTAATSIYVGSGVGSSNNTFAVAGGSVNSTLVTNTGELRVGYLGSAFNTLTVADGTIVNNGALGIGVVSGASSNNRVVINAGGVITNVVGLSVGTVANANFNSLIVTSGGSFFMRSGAVNVGFSANGNTVLLSNSFLKSSSAATLGNAGKSNSLTLFAGSVWDNANQGLNIGVGASTGNVFTVAGGILTNVGQLTIGFAVNAQSNQLLVINGGIVSNVTNLRTIGGASGASYNSLIVTNGGRFIQTGGDFLVGAEHNLLVGGGNNTVILSNSVLLLSPISSGGDAIGVGSSNNTVTLLAHTLWNPNNTALTIGKDAAVNNSLTVNGGVLTNVNTLTVGSGAGAVNSGNSLVVTNGGELWARANIVIGTGGSSNNSFKIDGGSTSSTIVTATPSTAFGLTIGNTGSGYNSLTITNAKLFTSNTVGIGNGSSNNTVTLFTGSTWDAGNQRLNFNNSAGAGGSTGNVMTINGGVLKNVSLLYMGLFGGGDFGSILVTNGGVLETKAAVYIGADTSHNNSILVTGAGSVFSNAATTAGINVGSAANSGTDRSWSNTLTVAAGGMVIDVGTSFIGAGGSSGTNSALVTDPGSVWKATAIRAGANATTIRNSLLISNGGMVEVDSGGLITATGVGNTISNVGGIFQFTTRAPIITAGSGVGSIAISNGTISYRGINNADVWGSQGLQPSSQGGLLGGMVFSGANTFRLNAASNTTQNTQNYTFNVVTGNPSNYVNLVLVNGHTAYGSVNGQGNITIGAAGSMLVSNTLATISGLVTNTGSLSVVNAYATFQSRVYNSGTSTMLNSIGTFNGGVINSGHWITDPTTNVFGSFGLTNTASGAISMAAGDVYIFGNTAPGTPSDFINISTNKTASDTTAGKFLFTGGLGLTQTFAVAGHNFDIADTATNLVYTTPPGAGFVNNFALGTLELSNFSTVRVTDAFLTITPSDSKMAGLYLENLFLGLGSLLIIETNVQVYFKNSNAWSLANIRLVNNQGGFDTYDYNNAISGLHQIVVIPEPSVLLLCVAGFATMWLSRRRHQRNRLL